MSGKNNLFGEFFDQATQESPMDEGAADIAGRMDPDGAAPGAPDDLSPEDRGAEGQTEEEGTPREATPDVDSQGDFTSIREEDLPPEARGLFRRMKEEHQAAMADIQELRQNEGMIRQYGKFLEQIEKDPGFQRHILDYLQGGGHTRIDPEAGKIRPGEKVVAPVGVLDRDEFKDLDDDEFGHAELLANRVLSAVEKKFERFGSALKDQAPVVDKMQALMERMEAQSEIQELDRLYPDWHRNVNPRELAKAKAARPGVSSVELYRQLDYDKALARGRRQVFQNGKRTQRPIAAESSGRATPPPNRMKSIVDFRTAIGAAIEDMGYEDE